MKYKDLYPRIFALGLAIRPANDTSLEGVPDEELKAKLTPEEYERLTRWIEGSTMTSNGVYPWDVEKFLAGLPQDD